MLPVVSPKPFVLFQSALLCSILFYTTYTTLHYTTLNYTKLHYTTIHHTHYTTLHYIPHIHLTLLTAPDGSRSDMPTTAAKDRMDHLSASEAANRRVVGQLNSQVSTGGDVVCIGRATMRMRERVPCILEGIRYTQEVIGLGFGQIISTLCLPLFPFHFYSVTPIPFPSFSHPIRWIS